MPILRHSDNSYTKISNSVLQNSSISLKAKGLLCYMLSCKDEWKFSIQGLATACGETKYTVEQALKELEETGYHKKELAKDNGRFKEWEYWISDSPDFEIPNQKNQALIITNNKKEQIKKKDKKENLFTSCSNIVLEKFNDKDIQDGMIKYLTVRIKLGLTVTQWREIAEELFTIADTKEQALAVIDKAYKGSYRKLYPINDYGSKKTGYVDNIEKTEKTEDGKLKDLYREEFSMIPPKDRPKFEEWRLQHERC